MNLAKYDNQGLGIGDIRAIILDFYKELEKAGKWKKTFPITIIQGSHSALEQYKNDNNEQGIELYQCSYCRKLFQDYYTACINCHSPLNRIRIIDTKTEIYKWDSNTEKWEHDITL